MKKITERTVYEHITALKNKEYSPAELAGAYLSEIEKQDERIGAFLFCDKDSVIKETCKAEKMLAEGNAHPLCAVPFAVKDNICTKGIPTTAASKILSGFIPPYDATVIERLKGTGAVILGKTNMDEFAMGSTTENSAYKTTKNPLDVSLIPGGSSGGSAAAVCAGMAPFALGSDTGGSIRQPASFCGCVGMCPTYGAVSRFGLIAFASSLDRIGPITKNCRDNALVYSAICGRDEKDSRSRDCSLMEAELSPDLRGLKIGIAEDFFGDGISDEVRCALLTAIEQYKKMGCTIVPLSLPSLKYATAAYYIISSAEASSNLARYDGVRFAARAAGECEDLESLYRQTRSEGFGDEVKRRIMLGTFVLTADSYDDYYKKAMAVKELVKEDLKKAFEKCDLMLSPAAPSTAYKAGSVTDDPVRLYMEDFCSVPQSLAGLPALSLPCSNARDGLPIGMQLTGPAFSEALLYRAGIAYEEAVK